MFFLGYTFLSGSNSLNPPAVALEEFNSLKLLDGNYKKIYASKDSTKTTNDWNEEWNENSIINTKFETGELDSGNSGFSLKRTDTVVIKRKEINSNEWVTIYTQNINTVYDFDFTVLDAYARGGDTQYIYRISSYKNGIENSYTEEEVVSTFNGLIVAYKDHIYGTPFDLDGCDTTTNFRSEVIETYNKYPTVASNSDINYETGSVTGTFIRFNEDCTKIDLDKSLQYRTDFKNFLASRQAFILKMPDGRIWMARCIGTPTDNMKDTYKLRQISFEWVEIGSYKDGKALYYNNLSDVNESWWS